MERDRREEGIKNNGEKERGGGEGIKKNREKERGEEGIKENGERERRRNHKQKWR